MTPKSKAGARGSTRRLAIVRSPPQTMEAVVISSTTARIVILLPEWSQRVALVIPKEDAQFPRCRGPIPHPAVNLRYTCEVALDGEVPRILRWSAIALDNSLAHLPTPSPAPRGIPGPPEILPILSAPALDQIIEGCVAPRKLPTAQREALRYLVCRAYGQGMARART